MDLTEKEKIKYEAIKSIIEGDATKKEIELSLGLSRRQIDRLIIKFKNEGIEGFSHKNKGNKFNKKYSSEIEDEIINLYLEEYYDYNFTHFYEELKDKYNISFSSLVTILNKADIISPEAQHKTNKIYIAEMKKSISEGKATDKEILLFEERKEAENKKHFRKSNLLYGFGEQIQMDAASYQWFGDIVSFLHLAVDKGTKKVLYGYFDKQETLSAYYIILWEILHKYGRPLLIRTDKRGCFSINMDKKMDSEVDFTEFGLSCSKLQIELDCSSDPVFKPNVERENKTIKGRLKAELRRNGICTIEEANAYLNDVFIPKINSKFSFPIEEKRNKMRPLDIDDFNLSLIISKHLVRKIDNASSLKINNEFYQPRDIETCEIISYKKGIECTIIYAYDGNMYFEIDNKIYNSHKVEVRQKNISSTKNKEEISNSKVERKPSNNHPWKRMKI